VNHPRCARLKTVEGLEHGRPSGPGESREELHGPRPPKFIATSRPIGGVRTAHLSRVSGHSVKGRDTNRLKITDSNPERRLLSVDCRETPRASEVTIHRGSS